MKKNYKAITNEELKKYFEKIEKRVIKATKDIEIEYNKGRANTILQLILHATMIELEKENKPKKKK